jgi:predicted RNase H-like HicB family nuclease
MPDSKTMKDYDIHVYWEGRAEYFVAEIQEIYTCSADGASQAEAVSNLAATFAVLKESYAEDDLAFPPPSPEMPISIGELSALTDIIKISRVAELAGIHGQTLATKLKRGTQLSVSESRGIARALGRHGLLLRAPYPENEAQRRSLAVEERPTGLIAASSPAPLTAKPRRRRARA